VKLRWLLIGSCLSSVALLASAFGGCKEEETLCNPGDEVFCKCRGGQEEGTKTCLADGNSFGPCTRPEGECPEIEDPTTSTGTPMICVPGTDVIPCECDNGDEGSATCTSDGLGFGDCTLDTGPCGTTTTGDKLLYVACASGSECQTGVCDGGYCTRACEDYTVCVDDANGKYGDCIVLEGGTKQQCAPYCTAQSDCAGFGAESACGGAIALDDATLAFAACANWGAELGGMPYGTSCDSSTGELLFIDTVIVMDCDIGLEGAQDVCLFGECAKGCDVDEDCPNLDCSTTLPCCTSDPDCN